MALAIAVPVILFYLLQVAADRMEDSLGNAPRSIDFRNVRLAVELAFVACVPWFGYFLLRRRIHWPGAFVVMMYLIFPLYWFLLAAERRGLP